MNIADFTTDANTLEQQIIDVKAYAAANAKKLGWDLIASLSDTTLGEIIGKRKNTRGAINAAFAYIKPIHAARPAQASDAEVAAATIANEQTTEVTAPVAGEDKAAERRAKRTAQQKARREAARAAKA